MRKHWLLCTITLAIIFLVTLKVFLPANPINCIEWGQDRWRWIKVSGKNVAFSTKLRRCIRFNSESNVYLSWSDVRKWH